MWIFLPLILLSILFRREMRVLVLILLMIIAVATWSVGSFWVERYDHWVDCGRPTTTVCPD